MFLRPGKMHVIMDTQWGSSGKGKLAAYLAMKHNCSASVCNFGPNAGHTTVFDDDSKVMLRFLPSASANRETELVLGPDCVFSVADLDKELEMVGGHGRTYIHPHACVLTSEHAERAKKTGEHIAGTMKGTGHALADKLLRKQGTVLAKHVPAIRSMITNTRGVLYDALRTGPVLNEMAQGFDLSLNWGREWPYCTSRDVTVGTALNNAGLPASVLGDVWGVVRPFPIRVGNIYKDNGNNGLFGDMSEKEMLGWSGPCWDDQRELTWDEVTKLSGSPAPLLERTTVTQRVRRVFTFSTKQLFEFCIANEPTHLFVNFIQYLDWSVAGETDPDKLVGSESVRLFLREVEKIAQTFNPQARVALVGTGAKNGEMVELPEGILR